MALDNITVDEMVEIEIKEFVSGIAMPVDVYLKMGDDKFILIAQKGDQAQLQSLTLVKSNSIKTVFVKKNDYQNFSKNAVNIVKAVSQSDKFKMEHKTKFIKAATNAVFTEITQFGASDETVEMAKDIANSTISMIAPNTTITHILQSLAQENLLNQSVAVSAFSIMIAQKLGWQSTITLEKLSMGALLAEVGLKEIPPEIALKPRAAMDHSEIQIYEEHPYRGLKLLESAGAVPDDVKSVVYEHHENALGMGYPRKLRDIRINPLAKVVALATQFCELTIASPWQPEPISSVEAIAYIKEIMGQPYNKEAFSALVKLVEFDFKNNRAV
jgi:HD-GYP domain-containing protein (c-di-GMP phosphodiesterase class II)